MAAPIVALLSDVAALDSQSFGGKASTLARLVQAGFACPPGVAVSGGPYAAALAAIASDNSTDFAARAASIHSKLMTAAVPEPVLDAILRGMTTIGAENRRWIVRSSAVGEDSSTSSFAGQLDSILDVETDGLPDAIRAVWASAWAPRAVAYRAYRGLIAPDDLPVAVLVQPFIEPTFAGVAFTTSPVPGEEGMLVECVRGRGEQLVRGDVAPVRFVFDELGFTQPAPDDTFAVPAEILGGLWTLGNQLVDLLGSPQDIEWVYTEDGGLQTVQSRPITAGVSATGSADSFRLTVSPVTHAGRGSIPDNLAEKDKFRLRLIATEADIEIGRGWLISCTKVESGAAVVGFGVDEAAQAISEQLSRFPQVSMVLQDPARLDGGILRQFSRKDEIHRRLGRLVAHVGGSNDRFDFIATEIFQARMSGISHIAGSALVVEVAFGSYVPKGVAPTSLYVLEAGSIVQHVPVRQNSAVFIEDGVPHTRAMDEDAVLSVGQLEEIRRITEVVTAHDPHASVEFGVLDDGQPYLIDIISDGSDVSISDVRVMSAGQLTGLATVRDSDSLATESLDAHFHSERSESLRDRVEENVIVVASRPFLALESHVSMSAAGSLGFVFEQGSLLGHLAIILREHGIPAVVIAGATRTLTDGELIRIDTTTETLVQRVLADASDA